MTYLDFKDANFLPKSNTLSELKEKNIKNLENVFTKNSISAKLRHLKTNVFYRNNLILAIIKEAMINLFLYLSWPFED